MIRLNIIAASAIVSATVGILGQTASQPATKVGFDCTCESQLASRYASDFRDVLAKSPRYIEAPIAEKKNDKESDVDWVVHVTATPFGDDASLTDPIAMSIVLTWKGFYLEDYVQICGPSKIPSCAADTLVLLDTAIHSISGG